MPDKPRDDLNDLVAYMKSVGTQMTELAQYMGRLAKQQHELTAAHERLRLAAQAAAEHARRAAEHSARAKRMYGEVNRAAVELPTVDDYDFERLQEAVRAGKRSEDLVIEAQRHAADLHKLQEILGELVKVHADIRNWLDEIGADRPQDVGKVKVMKENLNRTERGLRQRIAELRALPPETRARMMEADAQVDTLIARVFDEQ